MNQELDNLIDGIVTKYSEVKHNLQDIDDKDKHLILGHLAASIAIAYEDEAVVNPLYKDLARSWRNRSNIHFAHAHSYDEPSLDLSNFRVKLTHFNRSIIKYAIISFIVILAISIYLHL